LIAESAEALDTWMPSAGGPSIKEFEMPSPSLAFEALTYVDRVPRESPARAHYPPAVLADDLEYHDLLHEIRRHEGEIVENPPLLFQLTVALGVVMIGAALISLGLGVTHLVDRLV
jgi:hypothetical protein